MKKIMISILHNKALHVDFLNTARFPVYKKWLIPIIFAVFVCMAQPAAAQEDQATATTSGQSGSEKAASTIDDQFRNLIGRWRRVDGGYIIDIRRIGANGQMDVAYYNPKSIHISRAEASLKKEAQYIFIELQDVGYPGSTYTLMYRPQQDILAGFYFQATMKQTFEVIFAREK